MTLADVLFHLDEVTHCPTMTTELRHAARQAHRMLVAFKCARKLPDHYPAERLAIEAWATDESSRREDVPAN